MNREAGEAPSVDELWALVQEQRAELHAQRAEIEQQRQQIASLRRALRLRWQGRGMKRAASLALSLALVAVMGGVGYAAMPGRQAHPGANRLHLDGGTPPAPAWYVRSTGGKWTAGHILASDLPPIYQRTVIVSPVLSGGTVDPFASGSALIDALANITDAAPNNRYLLHIEPGTYDVGSLGLNMKQYVDIEGSGQGSTVITNSASNFATVHTNDNAELRWLTVSHVGTTTDTSGEAIAETTPVKLTDVTVTSTGAPSSRALSVDSGAATVTDSTLTASGESPTAIFVSTDSNHASLLLTGSSVSARAGTDGGAVGYGMEISSGGVVTIRNSSVQGLSGGQAYGVLNAGGTLKVDASALSGEAYVLTNGTGHALENGGTAYVGASRLTGLVHNSVSLQCAYDYDGNYFVLGPTCG
jgi:hypothetical protein